MAEEGANNNRSSDSLQKKWFSFSNISTFGLAIFMLLMIFNPNFKAYVIQALMQVGFFQPDISRGRETNMETIQATHFSDIRGQTINVADQKGKVVFLNFWATWCPPCIAEMPSINRLYLKYKDNADVVFLIVDVDGKIAESKNFMVKRNFSLPLFVPASNIPKNYFSGTLPTTVILDKTGSVAFRHIGMADYSSPEVSDLLDELVNVNQ